MRRSILLLCLLLTSHLVRAEVPLPDTYRMSHYRAPTPATLPGATVLSTAELHEQLATRSLLLIDVMPANRVPDGSGGSRWVPDTPRLDLPGSLWLPNVGYGMPEPEIASWFEHQLKRLTAGKPTQPLLFYCKRDCWMSWNAAKRALALGYQRVFWYPDGSDGWAEAGYTLQQAIPQPME